MALRALPRTGWSPTVKVFALIVVAGAFFTFFGPGLYPSSPGPAQPDDEHERVLDQYAEVLRNLTARLEVAERAVVELRRRSKASDRVAGKIRGVLLRFAEEHQTPPSATVAAAVISDQDPNDPDAAAQQIRDEQKARRQQLQSERLAETGNSDDHEADSADKAASMAYMSEDFVDEDDEYVDQPNPLGDVARPQAEFLKKDEETLARFRPDFKCGSQVPRLPDGGPVECDPHGPSPCCSHLGWCGRTRGHCRCKDCVIYRAADGSHR